MGEKCPYSELFWSVFSHIWTEYVEILRISPYSVRLRENTDQNNSEYGHFLRSDTNIENLILSPGFLVTNRFNLENKRLRTITDYDLKIIWFSGWPKNRLIFSWWPSSGTQNRGRVEFPISAGIGLVTRSVF